jgi:hypothetical protein
LVIHLDYILWVVHLLPICGNKPIPRSISSDNCLDAFVAFYVNKYIDHHVFEIA